MQLAVCSFGRGVHATTSVCLLPSLVLLAGVDDLLRPVYRCPHGGEKMSSSKELDVGSHVSSPWVVI